MKFDELKEKIEELKVTFEDEINQRVLLKNPPAEIVSDVADEYGRSTEMYCPHCGTFGKYESEDKFCDTCSKMLNKNIYSKYSGYATIAFEDSGDVYVLSTFITATYKHNNHIAEVETVEYSDRGYGVFHANNRKDVFDNDGKRKKVSYRALSYGDVISVNGVTEIWGVALNSVYGYRLWNRIDEKEAVRATNQTATVNSNIKFVEYEAKDISPLLFKKISTDNVNNKTHYEVWCTHCNSIFEVDLAYKETATCPHCGKEGSKISNDYGDYFLQINKNADTIDLVKVTVTANGFSLEQEPVCAYQIDKKGKTTAYAYENGSFVKTSRKYDFTRGYITKIVFGQGLDDFKPTEFLKYLTNQYRFDMMTVRRYFEAVIRNSLIADYVSDEVVMHDVICNFAELNFKGSTIYEILGLSKEMLQLCQDDIFIRTTRARELVKTFFGYGDDFLEIAVKIASDTITPDVLKSTFDELSVTESEFIEFFENQKRDGLVETEAFKTLQSYANYNKNAKLNLPALPEHVIVNERIARTIVQSEVFRHGINSLTKETFQESFSEFTLEQVLAAAYVRFHRSMPLYNKDSNGNLVIMRDDTSEIVAIFQPDGSKLNF